MSLSNYDKNKVIKLSIDNTNVDSKLVDFPVLVNLSTGSGQNNFDCTDLFSELEGDFNDDFTGTDSDNPNTDLWTILEGTPIITNNSLDMSYDNTSGESAYNKIIESVYTVSGDFDIRIDFNDVDIQGSGVGDYPKLYMYFFVDWNWYSRVSIEDAQGAGTSYQGLNRIDGSSYLTQPLTSDTSGKLRLTRVGNICTSYFWNGSSWTTLRSDSNCTTDSGTIKLASTAYIGNNVTGYFDNLKVYLPIHPKRKKIAVEYIGTQEHWIETVDDEFIGVDGSAPNSLLWTVVTGTPTLSNNTLDISKDNTSGSSHQYFNINSIYVISGDFDIQVDINNFLWENVTVGDYPQITLDLRFDDDNYVQVYRWENQDTGNTYCSARNVIGGTANTSSATLGELYKKVRLVRSGSTSTGYYWDGSDWVTIRSDSGFTTSDLVIKLTGNIYAGNIFTGYLDNFKINSGTIDWLGNTPNLEFKSHLSDRKQCYVEIENWDQANQEAQLWVKVPYVLDDQPTDLLLYYDSTQDDNTSYVGDTGDWAAQQVWDDNFVAVYHMSQDPSDGVGAIKDSTNNSLNGTTVNMDGSNLVTEQNGKALIFDGVNEYTDFGNTVLPIGAKSIFARIKSSSSVGSLVAMATSGSNGAGNGCFIRYNAGGVSNRLGFVIVQSDTQIISYNTYIPLLTDGNYHDITFTWDGTTGVDKVLNYFDGTPQIPSTATSTETIASDFNLRIAAWPNYLVSGLLDGSIEEINISNIARSPGWVKAANYSNNDNLLTLSSGTLYSYSGYVYQYGLPVQREVYLYERNSGELMNKVISNGLGYYSLYTTISGNHNVVCLDAAEVPDFEDLIISKITPTEVI